MGPFVLGILVGWLAEWVFYTFWVKAGEDDGDCSALKAELDLKNRQISSLQSQLAAGSENTASSLSQDSTKQSAVSNDSKTSASGASSASASNQKATSKSSNKAKPAKSTAVKPVTAKKAPVAKKGTAKKASTSNTSSAKSKPKASGDDFTKLSGIGPSMSENLKSLGITTFKKLADTDDDILRDMIEASGARLNNNKEAMDSWNEQATVAATGDFKALKAMQAALKK